MVGEGGDACVIGDTFLRKVGQQGADLFTEFPALSKKLDEATKDIQGWAKNPPQVGELQDDIAAFNKAAGEIEKLRIAFKVTVAYIRSHLTVD